jgi:SET domain
MINHSPADAAGTNTYQQVMLVGGEHRIGLYAARDIPAGEEILYCYHMATTGDDAPKWCRATGPTLPRPRGAAGRPKGTVARAATCGWRGDWLHGGRGVAKKTLTSKGRRGAI